VLALISRFIRLFKRKKQEQLKQNINLPIQQQATFKTEQTKPAYEEVY
jgi:hypothetical protein